MLYKVLSEIMLCKTFVKMRKNLRLLGEAWKCVIARLLAVTEPDG
ncbi:hypothetical protein HMPREF9087_1965 [Enterococcus casseliflavus ATCC 12755]|uniref:Uncharacterized protein n=1 Tax=Enterococcus casseliflavus ATCC 12755 TaxID=888066 RepID=F0EKQ9_ENTCA|nr:hypothetical protein HMPREF9087_1965 [Enterococcus casseliflavus ATCC 12755]EPH93511.1 hypothetical protein D922_02053 [Enterococcus faecalis 06-MB-DW-09]